MNTAATPTTSISARLMQRAAGGPWSMKAVYLLYFVAAGVYVTYLSLYLRSIHLSGTEIGLIASIVPLAGVVLQPLWGFLSDRYRLRKVILALSLLAAAVLAPCVVLAPSFPVLVLLVVALATSLSPTVPLSDATTLEWITHNGGSFGAVRIYGSIGFLLSSLFIGPALAGSHIRWLFPLYGLFLGTTFLASLSAPAQQTGRIVHRRGGVASVLRNRDVAIFLPLAAIGFTSSAAYNVFFALYLHGEGASTAIIGVAAAIASLSELPVMALSGWFMARFGVKPLLLAGLLAGAVRWTAYGFLHDYRIALVLQLLHGLSFAGTYVAGVTFVDREVPEQLRSTGQTLLYAATFGVGAVAGANLFGHLFDQLHAHGMFLAAGGLTGLSVLGVAVLVPNRRTAGA